jgi:hypothetical protein
MRTLSVSDGAVVISLRQSPHFVASPALNSIGPNEDVAGKHATVLRLNVGYSCNNLDLSDFG